MRALLGSVATLAVLVAALLWFGRSTTSGRETARPNVIVFVVDTLRADRLGCYGFERDVSPELDAMSRRGVRFARTVAQSSWTRPSIASLLTALHPRTLGIQFEERGDLPDEAVTLAEVLRDNGYRTVGATANPHLNRCFNFEQGFDVYFESTHVFSFMPSTSAQTPQDQPALASARQLFEHVLAALDEESPAERRAPHYLQFDVMEVHETWGSNDLVREEFKGLFSDVEDEKERRYLQGVRQVSRDIDAFLAELASRPGWEDNLVVLVSDHGEGLDSHPDVPDGRGHGRLLYESQVMVPWILFRTGSELFPGRVVTEPVRLLELMPTVLDLVGLEPPPGIRGRSLVPLIRGADVDLPGEFVVETHFRGASKLGVYGEEWKLFHNRGEHAGLNELELQRIGVTENGVVTDQAEHEPDVVEELASKLRRWELEHPPVDPVESGSPLSPEAIDQLRSLGYFE